MYQICQNSNGFLPHIIILIVSKKIKEAVVPRESVVFVCCSLYVGTQPGKKPQNVNMGALLPVAKKKQPVAMLLTMLLTPHSPVPEEQ